MSNPREDEPVSDREAYLKARTAIRGVPLASDTYPKLEPEHRPLSEKLREVTKATINALSEGLTAYRTGIHYLATHPKDLPKLFVTGSINSIKNLNPIGKDRYWLAGVGLGAAETGLLLWMPGPANRLIKSGLHFAAYQGVYWGAKKYYENRENVQGLTVANQRIKNFFMGASAVGTMSSLTGLAYSAYESQFFGLLSPSTPNTEGSIAPVSLTPAASLDTAGRATITHPPDSASPPEATITTKVEVSLDKVINDELSSSELVSEAGATGDYLIGQALLEKGIKAEDLPVDIKKKLSNFISPKIIDQGRSGYNNLVPEVYKGNPDNLQDFIKQGGDKFKAALLDLKNDPEKNKEWLKTIQDEYTNLTGYHNTDLDSHVQDITSPEAAAIKKDKEIQKIVAALEAKDIQAQAKAVGWQIGLVNKVYDEVAPKGLSPEKAVQFKAVIQSELENQANIKFREGAAEALNSTAADKVKAASKLGGEAFAQAVSDHSLEDKLIAKAKATLSAQTEPSAPTSAASIPPAATNNPIYPIWSESPAAPIPPTLSNPKESLENMLNNYDPASHLKVEEVVITPDVTASEILEKSGQVVDWGPKGASDMGILYAANYDVFRQSYQLAVQEGLAQPLSIDFDEIYELIQKAQGGDPEALRKLHEAMHWIRPDQKLRIINSVADKEKILGLLKSYAK